MFLLLVDLSVTAVNELRPRRRVAFGDDGLPNPVAVRFNHVDFLLFGHAIAEVFGD